MIRKVKKSHKVGDAAFTPFQKSHVEFLKPVLSLLIEKTKAKAVLLYGSYAQNLQDECSDIDILILTPKMPSYHIRKKLYTSIPDLHVMEIDLHGEIQKRGWDTSWIPVNDKLFIHGRVVEIGYNTVSWVNTVVKNLIVKQEISFKAFPFRPYTFLGLIEASQILFDRDNYIGQITSKIRPFPAVLKRKIYDEFVPIFLETAEELKDYSKKKIDILAYQFHLVRGLDALTQIVYALNDVYDPAFKRSEPSLLKLQKLPPHFERFLHGPLMRFYEKQEEVLAFFERAVEFIRKET